MANKENISNNFLHLSFKICDNTNGIFDKSNIIKKEEFDINEKIYVFLKDVNQFVIDKDQSSRQDDEILLFRVKPEKEEYIQLENYFNVIPLKFTEENINSLNYKLWYVIKDYPEENEKDINNIIEDNINEDYYLCENDIIRLGNFKFILKEIHLKNYNKDFFLNNKLWYVIKNYPEENEKDINNIIEDNINEDYYLSENDIIRLGNFKFILKEIHLKNYNKDFFLNNKNNLKYDIHDINKHNNPVFEFTPKLDNYKLTEQKDIICSICNKSNCNNENPIVSLCDCEFYKNKHYKCLKERFKSELMIVQNNKKTSINYFLK